jgi:[ribosomal protein S5]-alanine N-acetyltransferase
MGIPNEVKEWQSVCLIGQGLFAPFEPKLVGVDADSNCKLEVIFLDSFCAALIASSIQANFLAEIMKVFLETDRLILRNLTQDDVDDLVRLDSDPEVMRFINGGIATNRQAISNEFLPYAIGYYNKSKNLGFWAIVERQNQEFVGWIFLRPEVDFKLLQQLNLAEPGAVELGYRLRQQSWNKGYTTEVAQALIDKSFTESEIDKIVAWALTENKASTRVMAKVGLKLQQAYLVTADLLPPSLLENSLVQNLLDRQLVKYQLDRATWNSKQSDPA